jgi:hypothetical protein
VFPNHIRSKGVALANLALVLSDLVYFQVIPYAFAKIGRRFFIDEYGGDVKMTVCHAPGSILRQ